METEPHRKSEKSAEINKSTEQEMTGENRQKLNCTKYSQE